MNTDASHHTVADVIDAFGGNTGFARLLALKNPSNASEMRRSGSIHVRYWPAIIDEARKRGPELDWITADALMFMHAPQAEAAQ
jgi:hypothetical protein